MFCLVFCSSSATPFRDSLVPRPILSRFCLVTAVPFFAVTKQKRLNSGLGTRLMPGSHSKLAKPHYQQICTCKYSWVPEQLGWLHSDRVDHIYRHYSLAKSSNASEQNYFCHLPWIIGASIIYVLTYME